MRDQEELYRYGLSVEGFGGWADRLYHLLHSSMITFNQEHPCDQWYEPLLYPYQHYIPVKYDFRDLIGKIIWANNHPNTIQQIGDNANRFANKYLSREGILHYIYYLLKNYIERVRYHPIKRPGIILANYLIINDEIVNRLCNRN